jgi:N-acyl-D-amino-acid deacylase
VKKKADILIRGGLIYDGSLSEPYISDIEISGDRISAIGLTDGQEAACIIDAREMIVAPGFIDTHAHSDFTIIADPRAESKMYQGITTEINGNCGLSAAPLYGSVMEKRSEDLKELGIRERWKTLKEYFAIVQQSRISINMATLVGHGNIRGAVLGYSDRTATRKNLDEMNVLIEAALEEGAIGLSTGLIYPPGVYTNTEELLTLVKHISNNSVFSSHMRSEGDKVIESVQEMIMIAEAGIRVHISHLKTAGKQNWTKANHIISLLNRCVKSGMNITCDRYPYTASSTDLDSLLPAWVFEGGNTAEMKRLRDEKLRKRIENEMLVYVEDDTYWDQVIISSVVTEKNRWMEGGRIADISRKLRMQPLDVFFKILVEENLRAGAIFSQMSEENLRKFLSLPFCMIGSDSSARCFDGPTKQGKPHPRGFGTFPRVFGVYVRDEHILPVAHAIHKTTLLPARTFGLSGRGHIKKGMYADIVVFDPQKIRDTATYENPFQKPEGINHVLVNGVPVVFEGESTGRYAGRILRSSRRDKNRRQRKIPDDN